MKDIGCGSLVWLALAYAGALMPRPFGPILTTAGVAMIVFRVWLAYQKKDGESRSPRRLRERR